MKILNDSLLPDQKLCCQTVLREAVYMDAHPSLAKVRVGVIGTFTWFSRKGQFSEAPELLDPQTNRFLIHREGAC